MKPQDKNPKAEDLNQLRQRVRDLDEQILKLTSERLEVAKAIGRVKSELNLPIKDYKVEKDVIDRSRSLARGLGIYEDLAEDLSRILIKYAVLAQDEFQRHKQGLKSAQAQKILIVGGSGRMGGWLSEFFDSFGHAVSHFDPSGPKDSAYEKVKDLKDGAMRHDVIVLSSPIVATAQLIDEIAATGTKALIFDICSLKSPVIDALKRAAAKGLKVASAHPMFGPGVSLLAGRNILICHVADSGATAATRELFAGTTANIVEMPVEEHDVLMSYVLGLSHLLNLVFAEFLSESGLAYESLEKAASTTFNALLDVARPVVLENQNLYYEIQSENRHTQDLIQRLKAGLLAYENSLQRRDRAEFCSLMEKSKNYLSPQDHRSKS